MHLRVTRQRRADGSFLSHLQIVESVWNEAVFTAAQTRRPVDHRSADIHTPPSPGIDVIDDADRTIPPEPVDTGLGDELARGTNLGRYVVLERIGSGGMGVVYAAYDSGLERKVALKLLRPEASADESSQARLIREARAMAQLKHPNVNAVHDVGTFGGSVCIAMELVDGATLGEWLAEQRRRTNEILDVFVQAGRGLVAAHQAGLVHRDVKPDNILIGRDGRVRVTDFGLAREETEGTEEAPAGDVSVTRTGALLGSPAYMAPEQHRRAPATARTDQYALCVTLFEALVGDRPFGGDSVEELRDRVLRGRIAFPEKAGVPARLRRVVLRGLRTDPEDRFASVDELVEALEGARDERRALLAGVGALLVVAVVAGGTLWHIRGREPVCRGARRHLAGVWDAPKKEVVRRALLSAGAPGDESIWRETERSLDAYATAWVSQRTRACEATHVEEAQSLELLDLRMRCLDRRLHSVDAVVALLAEADAEVAKNAVQAVGRLPRLDLCADTELLTARLAPPPENRAAVEAIEDRLAAVQAQTDAGKFDDALPLAQAAVAAADEVDFRPVQAEAHLLLGIAQGGAAEFEAAETDLWKAVRAAEAGRHDEAAARAWNELVSLVGVRLARHADGERWAEHARAAVERSGSRELAADLDFRIGALRFKQGRFEDALASHRRSRTIMQQLFGREDHRVAAPMAGEASALRGLGRFDDSIRIHQRALDIRLRTLGPSHPEVASSIGNMAIAYRDAGRNEEALELNRRALGILESALGAEHPSVATELSNMANNLTMLGRYDEARQALERAMRIKEKAFEPGHPTFASTHYNLAYNALLAEQYEQSYEHFLAAERIWAVTVGPKHRKTTGATEGKAAALGKLGRFDEAIRECKAAIRLREESHGKKHFALSELFLTLGQIYLESGDAKSAVRNLKRSLELIGEVDAKQLAQTRFTLARAMWESDEDRARAVETARQARATFSGRGEDVEEIDAWLAAHNTP